MADSTEDDSSDDATPLPDEAEIGAAVDDAMATEIKRQKARFVQHLLGLDRHEGTGRREERWDEGFDKRHRRDLPDDPDR